MPVTHRVLEDGRLVLTEVTGTVDDDQLQELMRRIASDETIHPDSHSFVDLSAMDGCTVSAQALHGAAASGGPCATRRTAFFAPSDLGYGMARMYAAVADQQPGDVGAFRERGQALSWLGREETENGDAAA